MTARRQSSTTSLSKYARASSPVQNPSMDFCNAFWGHNDAGVDVLFARMRGGARTVEELKNYWKERHAIEEDYAKRLAKLAKTPLGRDEIGDLRNSLDTIRLETDRQAGFHATLAQSIKTELEGQVTIFHERQMDFKKKFQSAIEREYKAKQTQEAYVNKSREKYEQDCMRINSFAAQRRLVQGRDYEKLTLKLDKVKQSIGADERDFANFVRAYKETHERWQMIWVDFCDKSQDLEEDRIDFMKDNMWAYANAVSAVCVADDESCEKVRVVLEQMDIDREQENFVRDYGTGNQIPEPPEFIDYQAPDASIPPPGAKPRTHPSHFVHANDSLRMKREREQMYNAPPAGQQPQIENDPPSVNTAGIGAIGSRRPEPQPEETLMRQPSSRLPPPTNGTSQDRSNSASPSKSQNSFAIARKPTMSADLSSQGQGRVAPPAPDPVHPTADTYIKIGSNAYPVDPNNDPQTNPSYARHGPGPGSSTVASPVGGVDPLARQLEELQNEVSSSGPMRKKSLWRQSQPGSQQGPSRGNSAASFNNVGAGSGSSSLQTPGSSSSPRRSPSPSRDFRNSAEFVVGVHPMASRPSSPNPPPSAPTAAFMDPRARASPSIPDNVQSVVSDYHQSFPGEKKSTSRRGSYVGPPPPVAQQSTGQSLSRPPSQMGHVGVGAHGSRSPSPAPVRRSPSPSPGNFMSAPPSSTNLGRNPSVIQRAVSPNVGITLDAQGKVLQDDMAMRYREQQQQQQPPPPAHMQGSNQAYRSPTVPPQPQHQPPQPPSSQSYGSMNSPHRQGSYNAPSPGYGGYQPPQQYSQSQQPPPPHSQQPAYSQPIVPYQPPVQHQPQQPPVSSYSQPSMNGNGYGNNANQHTPPATGGYYQPPAQAQAPRHTPQSSGYQSQQPPPQHQQHPSQPQQQAPNSLVRVRRSPSPQPPRGTGQMSDEGHPILFYVQALYDYVATIEEEFDFQAGDIIAVTSTPEDGWWSGELLDENRRQRGRHIFPSNFVTLF